SVPDAPSLNFDARLSFSVAAWVRCSPSQLNGTALICKGSGNGGEEYAVDINGGVYRFYVRPVGVGNTAVNLVSSAAPNNRWQHVAAIFDGAIGLMQIYVNGQSAGSIAVGNSLTNNTHEVSIGNRQSGVAT